MKAFVLFIVAQIIQGYVYPCLDNCHCDTDDEVIHCHNGQRETLALPENRLRGFSVIGMTNNNIKSLPSEAVLRVKFPELRAIDIEKNPNFDCSTLRNYRTILIYSDCDGENIPKIVRGQRLPDLTIASNKCDLKCFAERYYEKFHNYLIELWKDLKRRYEEFDKEQFLQDAKEFSNFLIEKLKSLRP